MSYQREIGKNGVEAHFRKQAKRRGRKTLKFKTPGENGNPDRIVFHGLDRLVAHLMDREPGFTRERAEEHARWLVSLVVELCELKAPGKKLEPHQERRHAELIKLGMTCTVVDSKPGAEQWFEDRT